MNGILVQFKDFLYKYARNKRRELERTMKANQLQFQAYISRATYYIFAYSNYVAFDAQNFQKPNEAWTYKVERDEREREKEKKFIENI